MLGKILTKQQVEKFGLKSTYKTYGISEPIWRFYKASTFWVLLEEMEDGRFKVRACDKEERLRVNL